MDHDEDISGAVGDLLRFGTVEAVDLPAARATVRCGDVLSPPVPWLELAGAFRTWSPPSVGEQVLLLCPEADIAAAVILRGLPCAAFPAAGSDDDHVFSATAGLLIRATPDGLEIAAPGGISITGDVAITGALTASVDVVGGGKSLKSHKHGGVQAGGAQTGAPV